MTAFLGMGLLGSNFVAALRRREETVTVWNRSPGRTDKVASLGALVASTPHEAVRGAQRVHLTLKDDAAVDEVLALARPGFSPGLVIVDHTTTTVEGAVRRTAFWKTEGFTYVHAPVFMGPSNALAGTGTMLVSGDRSVFDRVLPALAPMTGTLKWVGLDPGQAAALKLVGNSLILTLSAGLTDVIALAGSLGINQGEVAGLFEDLGVTSWIPTRLKRLYESNPASPTWELQMARKDAGVMIEAADKAGKPLTVIPALAVQMDKLIAAGDGSLDYTVMAREARKP